MIKKGMELPTAADDPGHSKRLKKMMSSLGGTRDQNRGQARKFAAAAREFGCDDTEDAFDTKLKRVAASPPKPTSEKRAKKTAK